MAKLECRMNYIGSKYKLLPFIDGVIDDLQIDCSNSIFCDLFAGTSIVGRFFKRKFKKIISNDLEYYAYTVGRAYIHNNTNMDYMQDKIDTLNILPSTEGFIYNNYCAGSGSERLYYSDENGKKIDAIRLKIEEDFTNGNISENEYYYLLCSLLEASDKIANVASVYGAFLKNIKKSAQKTIKLLPLGIDTSPEQSVIYNEDANKIIHSISGDILYLDPPYNNRQYGPNYHLLNTIAKYDTFTPRGKTGLRDYEKSSYCIEKNVASVFDNLIKNADFKYILLSYNNEGLIPIERIEDIMSNYGEYSLYQKIYSRFKADNNREYLDNETVEYIHLLKKNKGSNVV